MFNAGRLAGQDALTRFLVVVVAILVSRCCLGGNSAERFSV